MGAAAYRIPAGVGVDEELLESRGYARIADGREKSFGEPPKLALSQMRVETLPTHQPKDDLAAQLDLVASMKAVATALVDALPEDADCPPPPPDASAGDDESLEGLVSTLLTALKTDQGRRDFRRLADDHAAHKVPAPAKTDQDALAFVAPRAFVPRPSFQDDVAHDPQPDATTSTIGNARAFAELLCADGRFTRQG